MTSRSILIVDDDVDALKLVGLMLERLGYDILAAASGQQAVQKAIEAQPALIILDVMMPDMDGYEVAARLRSHPATETIPILMFTAKASVSDRVAGIQAGANDYLTKPVQPRELVARVESLLQLQPAVSGGDPEDRGSIIGFLPTKGGLGTTTLTLNTALELKHMHADARTIVVELQEGNATMALQLGQAGGGEDSTGLHHLLDYPLSYLTKESLERHITRHASGLRALLGTTRPAGAAGEMSKEHVRTILRYLSSDYDYVLLDLPARLSEAHKEALRLCRWIIVTVEPNRISLELASAMLAALDELGLGQHKTHIVLLQRIPVAGAVSRHMIEQTLHRKMLTTIPPVPDLAYESVSNGRPIVEMQPQSLWTQQIRRLVQAIVES